MTIGLAGLILSLAPQAGNGGRAPGVDWAVGSAATVRLILVCLAASSKGGPGRRPALLGLAGGINFGLTSAYMKGMTTGLSHGLLGVLLTWQTYAMAASGLVALFLAQNALQAGRLVSAQPGLTLADPIVAIVWGVVVFKETTRGGLFLIASAVTAAGIGFGVLTLARSPLLHGEAATPETAPTNIFHRPRRGMRPSSRKRRSSSRCRVDRVSSRASPRSVRISRWRR